MGIEDGSDELCPCDEVSQDGPNVELVVLVAGLGVVGERNPVLPLFEGRILARAASISAAFP